MNGAGASGLKGAPLTPETEREQPRERDGEGAAALWAALTQRVVASQRLPLGELETPNAWRPSAGNLTLGAPVGGASGADAPTDPQAPERMVLHVDGGELGELSVTLEREAGALRVVIGLENEGFLSSVLPEARSLKSALEQVGLSVQTLNVVPASEVGTVLAQRRISPSGPRREAEQESSEDQPGQTQKRTHKRLTLIG